MEEGHLEVEAEIGVMHQKRQWPPKAGTDKKGPLSDTGISDSGLLNYEKIIVCCFKPPSLW